MTCMPTKKSQSIKNGHSGIAVYYESNGNSIYTNCFIRINSIKVEKYNLWFAIEKLLIE